MKTLDELEKLCEGAPQGPMEVVKGFRTPEGVRNKGGFICFMPRVSHYEGQEERYDREKAETESMAQLIAESRTAIPRLIKIPKMVQASLKDHDCIEEYSNETPCQICGVLKEIDLILEGKE